MKTNNPIKLGVSLYSYQEVFWRGIWIWKVCSPQLPVPEPRV